MLPLLALGLMGLMTGGGLKYGQDRIDERKAAGADKVNSLLGQGARDMGPPTEEGQMGRSPGFGLLQDPGNVENQARFMQGLLTLPSGQRDRASQMYGDLFGRIQQQGQFKDSQAQQQGQFTSQETRLGNQWGQQFGFQQSEAERAARQWGADFGLRRDQFNQQTLEHLQKLAQSGQPEMPKLSPGWMYTQSASGTVAAPIPGTTPYQEVVGNERALVDAERNIGQFLDTFAGKEEADGFGGAVRVAGSGSQIRGSDTKGRLSSMRSKVIADIAVLRKLGVINDKEGERIENQLTDPTSAWSLLSDKDTTTGAYSELREQFRGKLQDLRISNPWLLPPPPPGAQIDGAGASKPPAAPTRPSGSGGQKTPAPPTASRTPSASIWDSLVGGKKREYQ